MRTFQGHIVNYFYDFIAEIYLYFSVLAARRGEVGVGRSLGVENYLFLRCGTNKYLYYYQCYYHPPHRHHHLPRRYHSESLHTTH
jgi:hypothetical protein